MSYGTNLTIMYRQAAEYVAKVLSGIRPSEPADTRGYRCQGERR
jgi:hypothetical protein